MINSKFNRFLVLLVGLLTMCVTQVWGETITISANSVTDWPTNAAYGSRSWTAGGISGKATVYGSSSSHTALQYNSSNRITYNTVAVPGIIKSITLTKSSGTDRAFCVYGRTDAYDGSSATYGTQIGSSTTVTSSGATFTVTSGEYTYFVVRNNTSSAAYLSSIEVTYEPGASNTPTITKSGTLSTFTATYGSASAEQSFTVGGSNLTANISVSAPTNYEISKTSGSGFASSVTLNQSAGSVANTTLYVRLKNNVDAGSVAEAKITCSSDGATNQTITIPASKVQSKVNWSVNGSAAAGSPTGAVDKGGKVSTLPTTPESSACDGSKVFVGWTNEAIESPTNTKPSTLFTAASGAPIVNVNEVTYYAVFATESAGGNAYKLVSSLTNGKDYIFVTRNTAGSGYALSSSVTTGTSVTIVASGTDFIVSGTPANTIIWTAKTGWSLKNKSTETFLKINGSTFALDATGSTNLVWTTNYGLNGKSSGSTQYFVQCTSTGTFSKSSTSGSTTNRVYAYEYGSSTTYSNYTTTCGPATYTASIVDPAPTNGSFNLNHSTSTARLLP